MKPLLVIAIIGLLTRANLFAEGAEKSGLIPASFFADHMVIQQEMPVPVWGTATADDRVTVRFRDQEVNATADEHGKWVVRLAPMKAEPDQTGSDLVIAEKEDKITIQDVLVGEVWLCSGQSNMTRTVASTTTRQTALKHATNPQIRLCSLKAGFPGTEDPAGRWHPCTPDTADLFSAAGYYFGRELQPEVKVPIGLVLAAVGGTTMDYWIDPEAALKEPAYTERLERYANDYQKFQSKSPQEQAKTAKPPKDPRVRLGQHYRAYIEPFQPFAIRGVLWWQGSANATDNHFAGELDALIRNWRMAWGQGDLPFLVMQLPPWANREGRFYPRVWEHQKKVAAALPNVTLITSLPAMSWRTIHPPNKEPLGRLAALQALQAVYGRKEIVSQGPVFRAKEIRDGSVVLHFDNVGGGLIARSTHLPGFSIAGSDGKYVSAQALWTPLGKVEVSSPQVKNAVSARYQQVTGTTTDEIEFTAEQIAAEQRTGAGDGEKRPGLENAGDKILVDLDLIGGDRPAEESKGGILEGFAIAGADQRWVAADARIDGETVVVSSPIVKQPVAVRYGWYASEDAKVQSLLPASLWNREGLPAAPFCTDDIFAKEGPPPDRLLSRQLLDFYHGKPATVVTSATVE